MSLFKSAFVVGIFTLLSRVLGFIRDMVTAAYLGAGPLSDAFFVAFRLPNLFRALSAEGAFNPAFVPLFSNKLSSESYKNAISFAEHVLSFMFWILLFFTVLMEIFMPYVIDLMAPGFSENPDQFDLAVTFARITFPYLIFISIVSLLSGILNSFGRFAVAASAPVVLNLTMIVALLFLTKFTSTPAHALSWGVTIAGVLQLLWLIKDVRKNIAKVRLVKPKMDSDVKILLKRMVPGLIGGGITQINLLINTIIATNIASAVSYLYYADRLVQFPLAIIGTAMGTALLPKLSSAIKSQDKKEFIRNLNNALEFVMLLTLPAAAALIAMPDLLTSVLFEHGKFDAHDAKMTAYALAAYSAGLPAFVIIKVMSPGFFAAGDTKTPVKIAFLAMFVNIATSLSLISHIGHVGLAIATSFSSWVNAFILGFILFKRGSFVISRDLVKQCSKFVLVSIFIAGVIIFIKPMKPDNAYSEMLMLIGIIFGSMIFYFTALHFMKSYDLRALLKQIKRI